MLPTPPLVVLSLFLSTTYAYPSTNPGVAYSSMPHDGLLRFHVRQHSPITPSSTDLGTLLSSSTASSKENRYERSLIQPIHCRIGLAQPSPTLLPRRPQIALSVYNFQSMLTTQRQFNGYVFNIVFYPSGHFELLLQMPVRFAESDLRCHRGGETGALCL